jgi:hypothetical protein
MNVLDIVTLSKLYMNITLFAILWTKLNNKKYMSTKIINKTHVLGLTNN